MPLDLLGQQDRQGLQKVERSQGKKAHWDAKKTCTLEDRGLISSNGTEYYSIGRGLGVPEANRMMEEWLMNDWDVTHVYTGRIAACLFSWGFCLGINQRVRTAKCDGWADGRMDGGNQWYVGGNESSTRFFFGN